MIVLQRNFHWSKEFQRTDIQCVKNVCWHSVYGQHGFVPSGSPGATRGVLSVLDCGAAC